MKCCSLLLYEYRENDVNIFVKVHKKMADGPRVFYLPCFVNYLIILAVIVDKYSTHKGENAYMSGGEEQLR